MIRHPVVMVGGVGQLYQGDLDVGRLVIERIAGRLHARVAVEDLHYGAVAVAQRLQDLRPDLLVLVGAEARGRPAGTVEVRLVAAPDRPATEVAAFVADAVTGHVTIDLIVEVAAALGALPPRAVVVEVEPASIAPSVELSSEVGARLGHLVELVEKEVQTAMDGTGWVDFYAGK